MVPKETQSGKMGVVVGWEVSQDGVLGGAHNQVR